VILQGVVSFSERFYCVVAFSDERTLIELPLPSSRRGSKQVTAQFHLYGSFSGVISVTECLMMLCGTSLKFQYFRHFFKAKNIGLKLS
jgi:hypothetical protein